MNEKPDPMRPEEAEEHTGIDSWIEPFFTDSTLWPVVLVAAGCFATLGAAVLVAAFYAGHFAALGALLLLAWLSFDVVKRNRREGRLGLVGRCVVGLWGLSALFAGAGIYLGLA